MHTDTIRKYTLVLLLLGGVVCSPVMAEMYMCSDTIVGDVTDPAYPDCVLIDTFQDGVTNSVSPINPGRPAFSDITLTKFYDKSSVELRKLTALGSIVPTITIHFVAMGRTGSCEYYRVSLDNVRISSHTTSNSADRPYESFTLFFARVKYSSFSNDAIGCGNLTATWGWDTQTNTPQ